MEDPKAGVVNPAVPPAQQPGAQPPLNAGVPPKPPEGAKPPEPPKEPGVPGANTDPSQLLAALKEERERRRTAEAERDIARTSQPAPQAPAQPAQQDWQKQLDELWESDPRKAVQMEMSMGFQWYDQVHAGLEIQKDDLRKKYPDFNQYESQAMSYIRNLPLQQRSVRGVVEMAYLIEKGKTADQVKSKAQEEALEQVIKRLQAGESIQGITGGGGQPPAPAGPGLTAEELRVAEAMNMTPVDYLKYKKV